MAQASAAPGQPLGFAGKARKFWASSESWRTKYGTVAGLRVALALRNDYARPKGSLYDIQVPELRHRLQLRAGSADAEVFVQLFGAGGLDFPLPKPPEYVLDAGANIGVASAIFASRFPAARILAVEPEPGNFAVLERNAARYPRITPLLAAVWNRDGPVELSETASGLEHTVRVRTPTGATTARQVQAWTISALLSRTGWPRFDLIKLDIEGAELELLGSQDLEWLDQVSAMTVELHDRFRPGCAEAFAKALAGRGFERFEAGEYKVAVRH